MKKYAFLDSNNTVVEIIEINSFDEIPNDKFLYPIRANITNRTETIIIGSYYNQELDKFE